MPRDQWRLISSKVGTPEQPGQLPLIELEMEGGLAPGWIYEIVYEAEGPLVQGVGLAGIQIARQLREATVIATAGTAQKRQVCLGTGAQYAIDYRGDWESEVRRVTGGEGVDVVLDAQAGGYTQKQLDLLKPDGRLVFIASHLGETAEVNIRAIVRR